jgi:hypothetical protein
MITVTELLNQLTCIDASVYELAFVRIEALGMKPMTFDSA